MRFTKHSGRETPEAHIPGKWYDLCEFLDLTDLRERIFPPPRQRSTDPLAASTGWLPQGLLEIHEDGEEHADEPEIEDPAADPS